MYQSHNQSLMPEQDMAYTVLADLKRVSREYAIAATESTCPDIRQLFTSLLNSTLRLQGDLFQTMQQLKMYTPSSPALKQEIDKQLRQHEQTFQKTKQFLQQTNGNVQQFSNLAGQHQMQQASMQQPNNPYYM
ncbi:spore coat protein [Paenibacillus abyssi]|uniref:Coat protein F n=1 Tax=Paenibacillus abyssi TaxID=1340531 RepID=A0A917CWP8_9BACL|nr:spore coat protein [Paenibacillus abyssi]GGF99370.1 hypothetical protein GCM10010916_15830 [Paenibacillus abyssi]